MREFSSMLPTGPLRLRCLKMGEDLCLALSGGQEHLGAVALAHPRPSRATPGATAATASVLAVSGHKEDQLARELALKTASALNVTVCVCCGIHLDNADADTVDQAVKAARALKDNFITHARLTEDAAPTP